MAADRGRYRDPVAVVQLVVGDKTASVAALLLDHLLKALWEHGITLERGPDRHSIWVVRHPS